MRALLHKAEGLQCDSSRLEQFRKAKAELEAAAAEQE